MTKRRWIYIATFVGIVLFLAALLLPQFQSAGRRRDVEIIEALHESFAVVDWDEAGLILADGDRLSLPDLVQIPLSSQALNQATDRGVEVTPEGRVIGLVPIHHWCGNDPVRVHIVRIDLSHLLMFLCEAELPTKYSELTEMRNDQIGMSFSDYGWDVSEFSRFRFWSKLAKRLDEKTGEPRARARGLEP